MKQFCVWVVLVVPLTTFSNPGQAGTDDLGWMLGCWTSQSGDSREVWVRDSDRKMIGFGVAVNDGDIVFHEVLSIESDADGIHYTAHPHGQETTVFSTNTVRGTEVSFTNENHDYPQKIHYIRDGHSLRATISLLDGSNPTGFEKIECQ